MSGIKNPIKLREIIIALSVALILLVCGNVFDYQISNAIYDPTDTSLFGIILAGLVELPVCFALCFAGISLIMARPENLKKWQVVLCWIFGIVAIGVGAYFVYDTWMDMTKFTKTAIYDPSSTSFSNPAILILGIIFTLGFTAAVVLFGFFKSKDFDKHTMFVLAIYLIIIAAGVAIISNAGKFLWSRPRPRYIFAQDNPASYFQPIWIMNPLACLKQYVADNFKSFPSGHVTYATMGIFVFPYLTLLSEKTRNDRRLQVTLFYAGLLWALVACLARIVAGAHFLSDTAGGMITTILVGEVASYFMFKPKTEKQNQANA